MGVLMWLLELRTLLMDQVVSDQERAPTYHLTCGTVVLVLPETEWAVVNLKEMTWLLCVSQT
jgi:hypothetical protein